MGKYSKYLTDEQYARYTELLRKFNSGKRISLEEDAELEYLMALEEQAYEDPEYLEFAAEMDARIFGNITP
jgi:hypothetical protein